MSEDSNVEHILRQGIDAAKAGDRIVARQLLERVVDMDENNETAWLTLAQILPTEAEKRVALSNVLFLNPKNERALKMQERLDRKDAAEQLEAEEFIPGVSRSQIRMIVGAGVAIVLVLIIVVVIAGGGGPSGTELTQTSVAAQSAAIAQTQTDVAQDATSNAVTETPDGPTEVPTATQIAALPSAIPSATPIEEVVDAGVEALPPPPGDLGGTLVAWGGRDVDNNGYFPMRVYAVGGGGEFTIVSDSLDVRYVDISADGQQVIFTRFFPTGFSYGVERANLNALQPSLLAEDQPILKIEMGRFCASGNSAVFVAVPQDQNETQVFTFDFATNTLLRLTNDSANYTFPSFSPTCERVVVVKNDALGGTPGEDLVIIDTISLAQTPLTNNLGEFVETSPRWSPDGRQIAYAATTREAPNNGDIIIINVDGSGIPVLPVRETTGVSDERYPVYSPDGRYLAFASNRSGRHNIFIHELGTQNLWQFEDSNSVFPGGWG